MSADHAVRAQDAPDARARQLAQRLALLLAFGAGSVDAIAFSRLGDVFAGVMTGNLVLLGLSIGDGKAVVAGRVVVALVSFVVGVLAAGLMTRGPAATVIWPRRVTRVLALECAVVLVFTLGWQLADARPSGAGQAMLLACAAFAMGLQSGSVTTIGIPGLSTTYLTGTLTGVLTTAAHTSRIRTQGLAIVGALVTGAAVAALLLRHVPRAVPALPLIALACVVVAAVRSSHLSEDRA